MKQNIVNELKSFKVPMTAKDPNAAKNPKSLRSPAPLQNPASLQNSNSQPHPKSLKNSELHEKIKSLAREERALTQNILEHIAEIDRRKLYLGWAFPSLFEYLVKEVGYSAGAAQRRIDGARLLQRVPEVAEKINSGEINLGQISQMQKICRQVKKESGQAISPAQQEIVLQKISGLNAQQTELVLAQEFNTEIKNTLTTHMQKDESTRIEMTLTKQEVALLKSVQALLSHKTGGGFKETLLAMAQDVLKKSQPISRGEPAATKVQAGVTQVNPQMLVVKRQSTATAVEVTSQSNATAVEVTSQSPAAVAAKQNFTLKLKKEIHQRDQCCQFVSPETGKVCGSRYFLQIDHVRPRFAGGGNNPTNLRLLCRNHNIYRYKMNL